jgi:hypothetical protein
VNGKRLSKWLTYYPLIFPTEAIGPLDAASLQKSRAVRVKEKEEFYRKYMGKYVGAENVANAHAAVIELGERAYPLLLKMLAEKPSRFSMWAAGWRQKLIDGGWMFPVTERPPGARAISALLDLQEAGCDWKSLLPEIEKLAKGADPEIREAAEFLKKVRERNEGLR